MILYSSDEGFTLERKTDLSIGFDIQASEDLDMVRGTPYRLRTGIRLFLHDNEFQECQLRIRSSVANNGVILLNGIGTIDIDYPGEIQLLLQFISNEDESYHIHAGDRIGQLVFVPQPMHRYAGEFPSRNLFQTRMISREEIENLHNQRNQFLENIRTGGVGSTNE